MRSRVFLILCGLSAAFAINPPAQAIYGGSEVTGTPYVLTLLTNKNARTSFCSMALLTDRIVVTAAHCIIKDQGAAPELRWNLSDIYVSQPGADVTKDDIESRVHVAKVVTRDDFINTWKPEINDRRTQINDIAFLFLEKPLIAQYSIPIATEAEITAAIARSELVTHYGYGLQTQTQQSHSPWMTQLPLRVGSDTHLDPSKVIYTREGPSAICPGDSGGPWYIDVNGVKKIAAVMVAASGCRGNPPYTGGTLGTRIYPYMAMAETQWNDFLANEKSIAAAEQAKSDQIELKRKEAISNGTYLEAGGCHAQGINAELQIKNSSGAWVASSPTAGWVASASTCPTTHPVQPWTVVSVPNGANVRWRYWTSSWDVAGDPFTWVNPKKNSPQISSPPPPPIVISKSTITCVKGAQRKKVTALKPKCPSGWKKL